MQCAPTLNTLLDRELIRGAGKAPGLGRPLLSHPTALFLESFGLGSLKDLPEPETPPSREEREALEAESEEESEVPEAAMEAQLADGGQEEDAPPGAAGDESPPEVEAEAAPAVDDEQPPEDPDS